VNTIKQWLIAERFPSMVGSVFDDAVSARSAILTLSRTPGLASAHVALVEPNDPDLARKLEPESRGIAHTMIRAHLTLGATGMALGLVLAFSLLAADIRMVTASPTTAIITLASFGLVFGLMLGGLVGLRPDHDVLILKAREYSAAGKWFVIVHVRNGKQRDHARQVLNELNEPDARALQSV
jgi:hypothetical protein